MVKASRCLSFALKTLQPGSVAPHLRRQDFDCDLVAEQSVTRTINRAHPAFSNKLFYLVLPVQHAPDHLPVIALQHFAIARAEGLRAIVFCAAFRASVHRRN